MIITREDLLRYYKADQIALGRLGDKRPRILGDRIWKFERLYRKTEYYYNNRNKNFFYKTYAFFLKAYFEHLCRKRCCEFPLNVIDEGLVIWHGYNIIINACCHIGKNFSISASCNVGHAHMKVPTIGDNVTMSLGSKVLGGIHVCDHVTIGAGALVLKSIDTPYCTVGGVPAKILKVYDPTTDTMVIG